MADEAPPVLYRLLNDEHKETFLHFAVQQNKELKVSRALLPSLRDPLMLRYVHRRLRAVPTPILTFGFLIFIFILTLQERA